jgi:A/G-specific adenine glycosylase
LRWYRVHGRHDLPWKADRDPYRIWVSEIMLQQTQVVAVIPYFERFLRRFPDLQALARAPQDAVLEHWSGLGYYARARNLHRAARLVVERHDGVLPPDQQSLMNLPGIGRSTAAAILSLAHGLPLPILDGNVKRVLCRLHAVRGFPGEKKIETRLWRLAEQLMPRRRAADYTQAIMDLGAAVCVRGTPRCDACPVSTLCRARELGIVAQLPARRMKKPVPVQRRRWLVLRRAGGDVYLERRPPVGIWGGLWSFPECPPRRDPRGFMRERWGFEADGIEAGASLRHTLTHMHLELQPVEVRLHAAAAHRVAEAADGIWVRPGRVLRVGVAAPVRKLLQRLPA